MLMVASASDMCEMAMVGNIVLSGSIIGESKVGSHFEAVSIDALSGSCQQEGPWVWSMQYEGSRWMIPSPMMLG